MCLQLAAATDENVTSLQAAVTDSPPQVEHHGVAVNETMKAMNNGSAPAAATTKAPPATGTATGITLTSSTACLLTVVCVAIARLF